MAYEYYKVPNHMSHAIQMINGNMKKQLYKSVSYSIKKLNTREVNSNEESFSYNVKRST